MSTDKESDSKSRHADGLNIDCEPIIEEKCESREAKTFIPSEDESLTELPESITEGERLPNRPEYSGIRLEAIPIKGLRSFVWAVGIIICLLVLWDIKNAIDDAFQLGDVWGIGLVLLVLICFWLGFRLVWGYLHDHEGDKFLEKIRSKSYRYSQVNDFGNAQDLIEDMKAFYVGKPQAVYFKDCITLLPDYSNDGEVFDHVNRVFLKPLDDEILNRISRSCKETAITVAMSPWASLDMVFSLWRSIKMIEDISQVYGTRPSLYNRYKLLQRVLHQLVFVGATEAMMDQMSDLIAGGLQDSSLATLVGVTTARFGQGFGAAIYCSRIGIAAMKAARPIEFSEGKEPTQKEIIKKFCLK